jgi:hypothetical protein
MLAEGRRKEAEASLLASLEGLDPATSTGARRQTLRRLILLYEDWERPAEAARYRRMLSQAGGDSARDLT